MLSFNDIDKIIAWGDENPGTIAQQLEQGEARLPALRQQLIQHIVGHPLAKRYVSQMGAPNRFPWQAQGEQLISALYFLDLPMTEGWPELAQTLRYGYALQVLTAPVYLWTQKMWDLGDEFPVPRHTISRNLLPFPTMFWSCENAYPVEDDQGQCLGAIDWFFVVHTADGVNILYSIVNDHDASLSLFGIRYNTTYPDDYNASDKTIVSTILARLALLNSPYIDPNPTLMDRATRRQIERSQDVYSSAAAKHTSVVQLRHIANRTAASDPGDGREYHHRWWVSGHFRAQWYPSEQAHQLIWIAPYLKGPENAPLLKKTFVVKR